jgi:hypothetical protein
MNPQKERSVRISIANVTMMHVLTVLSILLATVSSSPAKPLSTIPLLHRDDANPFCYGGGHRPSEETYLQGVAQYCDTYVHDSISLGEDDLVASMMLKDTNDCPLWWIYKMRWEDDAGIGPVGISHDMCMNKFHDFVDDSTCQNGVPKFMIGGKYSVDFGAKSGSKLSRLLIETRQQAYDRLPKTCKLSPSN